MSCSKPVQALSFAEIIKGRDASVRVTDDGMLYLVDLVVVAQGSSRNYASVVHSSHTHARIPTTSFSHLENSHYIILSSEDPMSASCMLDQLVQLVHGSRRFIDYGCMMQP